MMRKQLTVTWDITPEDLAQRARREKNARLRTRLLAIRMILLGDSVPDAARAVGINERRVRNWVHRINSEGPDGLADRPRSGRPRWLTPEEEAAFAQRIENGPVEGDLVTVFHATDARRILAAEFGRTYSESGTYTLLRRLGFASLVPRPHHPKSDEAAQDMFKKRRSRAR
jgi:transposase